MVPRIHRWRTFCITASGILLSAGLFLVLSGRMGPGDADVALDADKVEAATLLVAWIAQAQPIPGFDEPYPDAQRMAGRRFLVACDCVPRKVALSADPRVTRVPEKEWKRVLHERGFDGTVLLLIKPSPAADGKLAFELTNLFGALGGHMYRFEFERKDGALRATGELGGTF